MILKIKRNVGSNLLKTGLDREQNFFNISGRMLRSLLSAQGVNPQMITVFIDGYYEVRWSVGRYLFFGSSSAFMSVASCSYDHLGHFFCLK